MQGGWTELRGTGVHGCVLWGEERAHGFSDCVYVGAHKHVKTRAPREGLVWPAPSFSPLRVFACLLPSPRTSSSDLEIDVSSQSNSRGWSGLSYPGAQAPGRQMGQEQ